MIIRSLVVFLLLAASVCASGPAEAVVSASNHIAKVPNQDRSYIRYFSIYNIPDKDRSTFLKVLAFHCNSLSRKAKLTHPQPVDKNLLYVDLRDYKWNIEVWEKLAQVEPFFHAILEVTEEKYESSPWPGGDWEGRYYPPNSFNYQKKVKKTKKQSVLAPWLPVKEVKYLASETESVVPIVRADWFFRQTAINEERVAGYYSFLDFKSRDDYFKLIDLDIKKAKEREREVSSIFQRSGVARFNRQIDRFGALDAGAWRTRDVLRKQTQEFNAVNNLNGDFRHDAEEHYGFLPNRLFVFYLSDKNGKQQDKAPPEIGPDTTSTSNDGNIHIGLSCIRCHVEGLRPLKDYGRKLFQGSTKLVVYDKEKFERLERLYLLPLQNDYDDDLAKYVRALIQLNGADWTPARNANSYKQVWKMANDDDVTLEVAVRELGGGITKEKLVAALRGYASPPPAGLGQLVPNALLAFMKEEPLPMLRDHWDECFPIVINAVKGYVPAIEIKK